MAPIDLKPATTLEHLFKRFLFILKPSVVHKKVNPMEKKSIKSSQKETNKHKRTIHHSNFLLRL